ncbi:Methyltransferase type 11 [Metarhizium album ARSEF 1941]|uniref:type I protein arginine methyltransferase n=1 Tax=Metarhizium album (strain ARSEF 1941) TaxID=1081103 RepID=A0A0B2WZ40_METAS|nr:Methyltransferase type 11 [Metarhizium album ARSEF 1941]KHN99273.1 Methyltransferase type 11 [Metarhizium album ARSEF 1941]
MDNLRDASPSSGSDTSEQSNWVDVEPDVENVQVVSLFDVQTFATLAEMLQHCREQYDFDLVQNIQRLHLDFLGALKLVNYIRSQVKSENSLPSEISLNDIDDERFLKPVLDNDAVIFSLDEVLLQQSSDTQAETSDPMDEQTKDLHRRNRDLASELNSVRESFANYRLAVEQTLDRRWGVGEMPDPSASLKGNDSSTYYFESYATHGILSMFCAKAGASKVIAVDRSDIIDKARENVFNNKLSDVVTCLRGSIEDVELPVKDVDIIVSEWMGYCLLYEAMLPSVLFARDKYLKPGGLLVPSSATLWISPVKDEAYVSDHVSYWRDVYGFDMKAMQEGIYDEVRVQAMPASSTCGRACPFKVLDLYSTHAEDLAFTANWETELNDGKDDADGFLIWFDIFFCPCRSEPIPEPDITPDRWARASPGHVAFTTGPNGPETHWKQGLLLIGPGKPSQSLSTSRRLSGIISFAAASDNVRALTLRLQWSTEHEKSDQSWELK